MKNFEIIVQHNFKKSYCNKVTELKAFSISDAYEKIKKISFFNNITKHNPTATSKKGVFAIDRHCNLIIKLKK